MDNEARLAKNKQIKEAGIATRARRSTLDCRVYHLKLQPNATTKTTLSLLFKEAKWLRNASLAAQDFTVDFLKTLDNGVTVKTPKGEELRELRILGSQLKQGVLTQLRSDLKALSVLKKRGQKIGHLKFAREVNSINLQQLGTTYQIDFKKSKARIQSVGWIRVRGLRQLQDHLELANAKLLQKPDGFYLAVTTYFSPKAKEIAFKPGTEIGLDMGVATHVTLSDGRKIDSTVQETDRLKRLQRKLARQEKGSKNSGKTILKIKREYQKMDYVKQDFASKLVHELLQYETVYLQDENLTRWKVRYGKRLQHSSLGSVKKKLAGHSRSIVLPKYAPTTQSCECGINTKHGLAQRVFVCRNCGLTEDRDIHAARTMVRLGKLYTSGTEGSARGGLSKTHEALGLSEQGSAKREASMTLVSA